MVKSGYVKMFSSSFVVGNTSSFVLKCGFKERFTYFTLLKCSERGFCSIIGASVATLLLPQAQVLI